MGQKLSKLSCCRRRHRGVSGRFSAVDLPLTAAPKSEDESSSVGAALYSLHPSPPLPTLVTSPLAAGLCQHAEKERSEPALAPIAALSLSSLGSVCVWGGGQVCVCV